ncbi:hypothetical protein CDV55_102243 [Aspergillus turcosus]|nr:hypothetical protein CDV55_102243 [Aspergillus turcosus]
MGQRHNRRRTRPRSRNRSSSVDSSDPSPVTHFFGSSVPSAYCVSKSRAACSSSDRFPTPSAQTWHHGYSGRQVRERKSPLEEQYRLFGGEPGDDVDLCYRMLEYFGGLDYIDPPHSLKLLPG